MSTRVDIDLKYNHVPAVIRTMSNRNNNLALDLAKNVEQIAKIKAPVLTGNLKLTIHVERVVAPPGMDTYIAQANTQYRDSSQRAYAQYVEFGTRYAHAQPFMGPAYVETRAMLYPIASYTYGMPVEIAAETGRTQ